MYRIHRNQNGFLNALDLHIHACSHSGKHAFRLGEFHNSGVQRYTGAAAGSLADLGNGAGIAVVTHRRNGDGSFLSNFQGEDVGFTDADSNLDALVWSQGEKRVFHRSIHSFFIIFHAADQTVIGSQDGAILIDGQQFQQDFFLLIALAQQTFIVGGIAGVRQGEQGGIAVNLLVFLC